MKWQIFSIYKIGITNDYLYANFGDLDEFLITYLQWLKKGDENV